MSWRLVYWSQRYCFWNNILDIDRMRWFLFHPSQYLGDVITLDMRMGECDDFWTNQEQEEEARFWGEEKEDILDMIGEQKMVGAHLWKHARHIAYLSHKYLPPICLPQAFFTRVWAHKPRRERICPVSTTPVQPHPTRQKNSKPHQGSQGWQYV